MGIVFGLSPFAAVIYIISSFFMGSSKNVFN
jgi:phage shock protein PspC (stress-responsive transcriptional regulator)